jgi:hypothetical protein
LADDVVDRHTHAITSRSVHAPRHSTVEHQPGEMRAHRAINDVGYCLVATRNLMQSSHIDTSDPRLSHTR